MEQKYNAPIISTLQQDTYRPSDLTQFEAELITNASVQPLLKMIQDLEKENERMAALLKKYEN